MTATGQIVTTKVLKLTATDIYAMIEKCGFKPDGWKFFATKVGANSDGSELTITMTKTEKLPE